MKSIDFLMLIAPYKPFIRPFDVLYPFSYQFKKNDVLPLPYGVLSLLGALRNDCDLGFYDLAHFKYLTQETLQSTIEVVLRTYNPKIVGLQSYTFNFNALKKSVEYIKAFNKDIITIAGGPHVTFLDKDSIDECEGNLDIVVRGEGETILPELVVKLLKGNSIEEVKGITTKQFRTADAPLLTEAELNKLALPAFELIPPQEKIYQHIYFPITSSRGCPYKCLFCTSNQFWRGCVRITDANVVINILNYLIETFGKGKLVLEFTDDILPIIVEKFERLVDLYISEVNIPVTFALTRANLTDNKRLELLKKLLQDTGILSIGLENGNESVLKIMRKPSWEISLTALQKIKEHDLKVIPSWIIGHPGESLETMVENLEKIEYLFQKNLINNLIPFIWTPLPGTEVFDNPEKYHVKIVSRNWDRYDRAIFLPPFHLMDTQNENIVLSNQQIWAYFLNVISLCNKKSQNSGIKDKRREMPLDKFLNKVRNDNYYTLFNPTRDGDANYFVDLDSYLICD